MIKQLVHQFERKPRLNAVHHRHNDKYEIQRKKQADDRRDLQQCGQKGTDKVGGILQLSRAVLDRPRILVIKLRPLIALDVNMLTAVIDQAADVRSDPNLLQTVIDVYNPVIIGFTDHFQRVIAHQPDNDFFQPGLSIDKKIHDHFIENE